MDLHPSSTPAQIILKVAQRSIVFRQIHPILDIEA
jgi:hypothetical protein